MNQFDHESGRSLKIDDAMIYIEETGNAAGFPVVFLHGGLGSMDDFSSLVPGFAEDFRIIGVDSRGHGKSTSDGKPLSYELLENDVEAIIGKLNISRCCLLGFSDGGVAAYRLAIRRPALVARVATIGANWNAPSPDLRDRFSALTPKVWREKFPGSVKSYETLNPEPDFDRLLKSVVPMWVDPGSSGYPGKRIAELRCESLIIRGDDDHLMPRSVIGHLTELLPSAAVFNIPFAGHMPHVDQRELVTIVINQFFSRSLN